MERIYFIYVFLYNETMIKKNKIKKESLYLNSKVIADVYYKENDTTVTPYLKQFLKQYKRLIDFFNVQPPKIYIYFVYTRIEMDKHWGRKSKITAMVDNKNPYLIYIFSPLVFEKLTTHKKYEILPTIIHETAHTFVTQINKRCFAWANEGVCQYVEGKNIHNNIVKKENWEWFKENKILIDPVISWRIIMEHEGYKIAYLIVKYIIKLCGKQAIIDILSIRRMNRDRQIEQKISKILKSDLSVFLNKFEKKLKLV